jgi:beta-glucosidase/6-phospho-beta-glucosidase/beta-galactosidase
MRRKLDSFSDYYEESLGEDLDEKKIDQICNNLTKKYEQKYNTRESGVGATDVHTDSAEVQDTEGLCESECATVESTNDSTEIA